MITLIKQSMQGVGTLAMAFVAALIAVSPAALAQDATLDRARQLQSGKQAKAAFHLLAPLEQERAGQVDFDYLFGVIAIDAGEPTRAVFALERVLAVRPDHPQARAEIARAYFEMGENRAARLEFEAVRAAKPPTEVAAIVDRFLSALDTRQAATRSGWSAFVEGGLGHDSNVNSATAQSSFALPAFGGNTVQFDGTRRSGLFYNVAAGISGRYVIDNQWSLFGNGSFSQRYNPGLDRFDTGSYGADGGVIYRRPANEYTAALQTQVFDLDRRRFRNAFGGLFQWRHDLSQTQQLAVYAQLTRLTYPQGYTITNPSTAPTVVSTNNSDGNALRTVAGVAWANAFEGPLAPAIYLGIYGGEERLTTRIGAADPGYNLFRGHRLLGARIGGQVTLTPQWNAFANFFYEDRNYGGAPIGFFDTRADKESNLRIGANYAFQRNWTLTPQFAMTENKSNIVTSAYRRNLLSATLRYDFR